jgi:Phytanoyl-CoA dioxygenase (PhyH)
MTPSSNDATLADATVADAAPRWEQLATTLEPWLLTGPLDDTLRAEAAEVFDDLGFVLLRGVFTPEEVDELDADLVRVHELLMDGELDSRHAAPELEPPGEVLLDGRRFRNYVVYANHVSPVADRMIRESAIADLSPRMLGGESFFYDYDRHGVMYLDARGASSYKGLVWHPDFESTPDLPIWPAVAFTINLDATSPENGFLRMLPGSHKVPPATRPSQYEKVRGEVAVYCERGDLLLHHSHLWHAASRPSNDEAIRRHIRGKWCSGQPIPAGAWDGSMNNTATMASGR